MDKAAGKLFLLVVGGTIAGLWLNSFAGVVAKSTAAA